MSSTNSPASECGDKHKAKVLLTREVYDFFTTRREAPTSADCECLQEPSPPPALHVQDIDVD